MASMLAALGGAAKAVTVANERIIGKKSFMDAFGVRVKWCMVDSLRIPRRNAATKLQMYLHD